jgi:hypothetical protein
MTLDRTKKHSEPELLSETYFSIKEIAGGFGSVPVDTGAQTINIPASSFETFDEAVTFGVFKNQKGDENTLHPWKGKTLRANKLCTFGPGVATFSITDGGDGQFYKSGEPIIPPQLLTAETNELGTKVILTFDRTMTDPSADVADFIITIDDEVDIITAAALGSNTKTIELTHTTAVVNASVVTVEAASGNIKSVWGGILPAVPAKSVTNLVP